MTHDLASFIWDICNLLRGPYKRNEYRRVILPLTLLVRLDALLVPTKEQVLNTYEKISEKPLIVIDQELLKITKHKFYNFSSLTLTEAGTPNSILNDPDNLAQNISNYINAFSSSVCIIMDRFSLGHTIAMMEEKGVLYKVFEAFCDARIDLSYEALNNQQMGYVFEELIRIGSEQANEEAGEHFTPREVIRLMVNLLLDAEVDLTRGDVIKTLYDPACGTGGMLSMAEEYLEKLNPNAKPELYGQDWNDGAWAVCRADRLIKGENANNIALGDIFTRDGFDINIKTNQKWTFDYMLANPPFGVEWKQQQKFITEEAQLGDEGRFGAGLPRISDGAFLFLQHMISKMRPEEEGGSRIAIVFNGSPLFIGDAGSGESEIRRWIIENDWLEGIVALPDQLFYNTGIATYIWILTNRKEAHRKGKIQLLNARDFWVQMEKSMGNKRRRIGEQNDDKPKDPPDIADITAIYRSFTDGETFEFKRNGIEGSRVVNRIFDNSDFGYYKVTVERPLRLSFSATPEHLARLEEQIGFKKLIDNTNDDQKKAGLTRQNELRGLLAAFVKEHGEFVFKDRKIFLKALDAVALAQKNRMSVLERRWIVNALSERDEEAAICFDAKGNPEPDVELRDIENIPLKENIAVYIEREVLPNVPDAWLDHSKTRVGYEIPLNQYFSVYERPRSLEEITAEIKTLEGEIMSLLQAEEK